MLLFDLKGGDIMESEQISDKEMKVIEEGTNVLLAITERLCEIDDKLKELDNKIDLIVRILIRPYDVLKKMSAAGY